MDSAGKRETRPPDRLLDALLNSNKIKTVPATMTNTVTTSNPPIITPPTVTTTAPSMHGNPSANHQPKASSSEKPGSDPDVQAMLRQVMTDLAKNHAQTTSKIEKLHLGTEEKFTQCLNQYQLTDTRLAKLEDDNVELRAQGLQQSTTNSNVSGRLTTLEDDIVHMRNDISRLVDQYRVSNNPDLSHILKPTPLSSTSAENCSVNYNTSSMPPAFPSVNQPAGNLTMFDSARSSFLGPQERFQDAVAEFSGQIRVLHPEKFIAQVDVYFESVFVSPSQQLISAQRRLVGDAQVWYESLIPSPRSYAEFRQSFRQHFWSSATQRKARNEVFRPYQYTRYDGLATHAMKWIAGAKYLSPPIEQADLVSTIIQHYPTPLGMAIRGRGPRDTNELLSVLKEFEESASFCERRREENNTRPPFQHQTDVNQQPRHNFRRDNNNRYSLLSCMYFYLNIILYYSLLLPL